MLAPRFSKLYSRNFTLANFTLANFTLANFTLANFPLAPRNLFLVTQTLPAQAFRELDEILKFYGL